VKLSLLAVFCCAVALLSVRAAHLHLADTYLDPIGRVDAQDESMYASNAFHMADRGDWLTPIYQGRYGLYKPPLLAWLAGASAKILGDTAFAVRFPVLLIAALTACLVFLFFRDAPAAGIAAALLLIGDRLWFTLSSLCLTDSLLTAFIVGAAYCLYSDPKLESRRARWGFVAATAAAILVKSVAGIVPFLILLFFRPSLRRLAWIAAATAVLVLPWGLYQLAVHPRWFWNEFVLSEIVTYGVSSPVQTTQENQFLFYLKRLFLMDPILGILVIAALTRIRRIDAWLLMSWLAVVLAAAVFWSYRNVTYLAPAIPALAILAARAIPPRIALPVAAVALIVKLAVPSQIWALDLRPPVLHPSVTLLDDYARLHRGRELILVDPFDGFYSSTLPLPKVRYCFVNPAGVPPQGPLDLHYLGIVVSGEEFADLGHLEPVYRARLREWNLDSAEPIATAIVVKSREEADALVAAHPQSDFLLPAAGGFRLALSTNP
jgi:4-amino-4-deoxy-L-arabinose transferase-like glycosyltransferase